MLNKQPTNVILIVHVHMYIMSNALNVKHNRVYETAFEHTSFEYMPWKAKKVETLVQPWVRHVKVLPLQAEKKCLNVYLRQTRELYWKYKNFNPLRP